MTEPNLIDEIRRCMDYFPKITRDEADYIEEILNWDNERKAAFLIAKQIFEEED